MSGKDIPNSGNLKARASRSKCPIESGVSDLAARAITDNQEGYSHKSQENRKSRRVPVVSGRDVVPEFLEVHRKEGRAAQLEFGLLKLSLCFLQVKVSHGFRTLGVLG